MSHERLAELIQAQQEAHGSPIRRPRPTHEAILSIFTALDKGRDHRGASACASCAIKPRAWPTNQPTPRSIARQPQTFARCSARSID